jgi:hypothetical protein
MKRTGFEKAFGNRQRRHQNEKTNAITSRQSRHAVADALIGGATNVAAGAHTNTRRPGKAVDRKPAFAIDTEKSKMKITLKEAINKQISARSRYAAAAQEFRESMAELGALDQLLSNRDGGDHRSFGEHPPVTMLRHPIALPEESGSIGADINAIVETTQIEG